MTTPPPPSPSWTNAPLPPAVPPPPTAQPAGWYVDPWDQSAWRWYDGHAWTAHVSPITADVETKKPRLPSFLSVPVILCALPSLALLGYALFTNPKTVALGLVPLLIVGPVLIWMDRLEPEPWSSRLHTLLWGAFVAGIISLAANTGFAFFVAESGIASTDNAEVLAAVISAPIVEEITKGLAILWMVRRKEVDSVMDGLVYAGWSALGFAVIEDVSYFYLADEQDLLWETFIGRAFFTPFAHPLFTAWIGLAVGLAIRARKSLWRAWWGLLLAIGTHAAWNGSLSFAESEGGAIVAGVALIAFVVLFLTTIVAVIVLQRRDQRRYLELLPAIAARYGLPPERVTMLMSPKSRRAARKALPKDARRKFDDEAGAVARLAAMLDHDGTGTPDHEARLVSQLVNARRDG